MKLIDVHMHLGEWMFPIPPWGPAELLAAMDRYGIVHGVVSSSSAILYDFAEGNRELAGVIAGQARLWGYIVVNPHYPEESVREIDRYRKHPKFRGVKFHPEQNGYEINSPAALRLFRYCEECGLPVLVHTFGKQAVAQLGETAGNCPGLAIIMAHMGGDAWREGIETASRHPNIYLEPCTSFCDTDKIAQAVAAIGADRFLFGSDATLLDPGFTVGMLQSAAIEPEQRERIAYRNAQRILGLTID